MKIKHYNIGCFDNDNNFQKITHTHKLPYAVIMKMNRDNAIKDARNNKPSAFCVKCGKRYGLSFMIYINSFYMDGYICQDCKKNIK